MKNFFLSLILLLPVCQLALVAQNEDWQPMPGHADSGSYHLLIKQDGNITYVIDSTLSTTERKHLVAKTGKYITNNLAILRETEFNELTYIILVPDRGKMYKWTGEKHLTERLRNGDSDDHTTIVSVYDSIYNPLNRELMLLMSAKAWGEIQDPQLFWLKEGLATYANPEADSCDGHTFEERYVWFEQSGQLIDLAAFPEEKDSLAYKIGRHQSAYTVEWLLKRYGVDQVKQLWRGQMTDFEKIFGVGFEDLAAQISQHLKNVYTSPILFEQEAFNGDCIGLPPDGWLAAYNPPAIYLPAMDRMVTKEEGNLKVCVNSTLSLPERDRMIERTKELIAQHLKLLDEPPFNDTILLILVPTRNDMNNLLGGPIGGTAFAKDWMSPETAIIPMKDNMLYAVHIVLGHELMHLVAYFKWGNNRYASWLDEGLATLACPEAENCDGHSFEERYVYFLQNGKLIFPDSAERDLIQAKTEYNRDAYIVEYLISRYGIKKLKQLWQCGSEHCFEEIYGLSLDDCLKKMHDELNVKYPDPIDFNWERFSKDCIE